MIDKVEADRLASFYIAVRVDEENAACEWWDALREKYPAFARALSRDGVAVITANLWDQFAALDGFESGPNYARLPVIDCGTEGDQWADVVAQRHQVFEVLS